MLLFLQPGIGTTRAQHLALLPHEAFASIYKHPELFKHLMGDDPQLFWQESRSTDWFSHYRYNLDAATCHARLQPTVSAKLTERHHDVIS